MGSVDVERQSLNVFRMKLLGAKVTAVDAGSTSLKDALNEALRDWIATVAQHLLPHRHRRRTASVPDDRARLSIGDRTRGAPPDSQARGPPAGRAGRLRQRRLQCDRALLSVHQRHGRAHDGVEAGGLGLNGPSHAATITAGSVGVLHGNRTYLLQDELGQIRETHSIAAGLDYPGRRPGARLAQGERPRRVRRRHRRRGARRPDAALRDRGHHPGAGERARGCVCDAACADDGEGAA